MKLLSGRLLVCLLLLEVVVPFDLKDTSKPGKQTVERYMNFNRQHVDNKMTVEKCTAVIKQKNIYSRDNSCKSTNTFILADASEVKSICKGEGEYLKKSHLIKSKMTFSVVVCTLKTDNHKPKCEYSGKLHRNRFVVVQCSGVPVQFAENIQEC